MRTITIPLLRASALAAGLFPLAAYSDDDYEANVIQPITFALTETYEVAGLAAKDDSGKAIKGADPVWENEYDQETSSKSVHTYEYASKLLTYKISNKEILMDLVDEGVIPSITGYSISFLSGEDFTDGFYLTKKGMEPIDLSEFLSFDDYAGADIAAESGKEVSTYDYNKDTETFTATGKGSGKVILEIDYETSNYDIGLQGVATWSDSLKSFGKGEDQFYAWIPSPGKVSSISGSLNWYWDDEEYEDDEDSSLIEGSISMGSGSLFDFTP